MASQQKKDEAIAFVNDFRTRNPSGVWLNIAANTFANGLTNRINDPDLIDTGLVNLCGPGAFTRFLADDDPLGYARIGIDLFQTGRTILMGRGPLAGRIVEAGYDLRNYPVPNLTYTRGDGSRGVLDPADWVILASIRDSDNWFFDYQSIDDGLSGITLPHTMESWLAKAGFTTIINDANIWFTKDQENAARASNLRNQGYKVTLLINANMLQKEDTGDSLGHSVWKAVWGEDRQDVGSVCPDHWVGLASDIRFINDINYTWGRVECSVHSWGKIYHIPVDPNTPLSHRDFLANYYGFVACKY